MNIQLFLANQEVELSEAIRFPLNKTFSDLNNPTDIIVDYSKSINIPMTMKNNKIFANAYRLDRSIVGGGDKNLGLYLDPSKRIPMRLMYNGSLVLEGYAKYASATYSLSSKFYTINLYGQLGSIFQELMKVVSSESLLGDNDSKYLLKDPTFSSLAKNYSFNKEFAQASFNHNENYVWTPDRGTSTFGSMLDVYGVAPTYRGLYNDFDSKKIQTSDNTIEDISKFLNSKWDKTLTDQGYDEDERKTLIESYNSQELVGDGFPDYQMNQYASNKLKPYVYINQLFRMFDSKCKELTGYTMDYDRNWFNVNNPYWAKMVYMFDFLDRNKTELSQTASMFAGAGTAEVVAPWEDESTTACGGSWKMIKMDTNIEIDSTAILAPFDVTFGCTNKVSGKSVRSQKIQLLPETVFIIRGWIRAYNDSNKTSSTAISSFQYWTSGNGGTNGMDPENYTKDTFVPITSKSEIESEDHLTADARYTVTIPSIPISRSMPYGGYVEFDIIYYNETGVDAAGKCGIYLWDIDFAGYPPGIYAGISPAINLYQSTTSYFVRINPINRYVNWKNSTPVSIASLYKKDTPIFNILLEYTKMFNLKWDIDYQNKKIGIKTLYSYYKDTNILDWNDKVDRSKEFKIEPLIYNYKNIKMNYKDVDGNHYSDYRDEYGVNIGEKIINTGYEFNTSDKELFKDISPSSCSSKTFVPFLSFQEWDFNLLTPTQYPIPLIDCESEDGKSSISINNWYLRGENSNIVTTIIDETPAMIINDTQCYISDLLWREVYEANMPVFTTAAKYNAVSFPDNTTTYGCFFNTPNVDYTSQQLFKDTLNSNIYEYCWKDWLNESLNIQNKKLTAYIRLTQSDYNDFNFNNLVHIDNQLFRVNKIMDYNIGSTDSTKCELVQVNNPNNLTSKTFPQYRVVIQVGTKYYTDNDGRIVINGTSSQDTNMFTVYVYGLPFNNTITFSGLRPSQTLNTGSRYNYYTARYVFSNLAGKRQTVNMNIGGIGRSISITFDHLEN